MTLKGEEQSVSFIGSFVYQDSEKSPRVAFSFLTSILGTSYLCIAKAKPRQTNSANTLWISLHLKASCREDPCIVGHHLRHAILIFWNSDNDKRIFIAQRKCCVGHVRLYGKVPRERLSVVSYTKIPIIISFMRSYKYVSFKHRVLY